MSNTKHPNGYNIEHKITYDDKCMQEYYRMHQAYERALKKAHETKEDIKKLLDEVIPKKERSKSFSRLWMQVYLDVMSEWEPDEEGVHVPEQVE